MRQDKDRCGKWLIDHYGGSILRLGKVTGFISCRAAKSEQVAPRRLPDGLLEVAFPDRSEPDPFIVEIETYADRGISNQVFEDILITRLERGVMPDVITLILRPKGQVQVERSVEETGRHGLAALAGSWRVVEVWKLDADDLFAANDVGLIPWVPLTRFSGPPEQILRQCRERIDKQAKPEEHDALLTVTSLLTAVVFNDEALLEIFGGLTTMIESPLMDRIEAIYVRRTRQADILRFLKSRFGPISDEIAEKVRAIDNDDRLQNLLDESGSCPDLTTFQSRLSQQ